MASEHLVRRYRGWYAKLLRLYSKPFYERFGEGMEQTFSDRLHERAKEGSGLSGCALWMFAETTKGLVRENMTPIMVHHKNILRIGLATALLLLLPLVAMQFTDEVVWDSADFVVAGVLLFGAGLTYELVARNLGSVAYRVAVGIAVAAALILVWINLAVGLIGSESHPANLMYSGVLAVGVIGTVIARFHPRGMARALFATAFAQALVPIIALIVWKPGVGTMEGVVGIVGVFSVNAVFVLLFFLSAGLFRTAAGEQPAAGATSDG